MKKHVNHLCGECGATGSITTSKGEVVCPACNGVGYQSVEMSLDHDAADRLRLKARRASLEKFIILLSALIGACVAYFYAWHFSTPIMLASFAAAAVVSYLIMQIPVLQGFLQKIYDLFRIGVGFVVLVGGLAGVAFLIYKAREYGGW